MKLYNAGLSANMLETELNYLQTHDTTVKIFKYITHYGTIFCYLIDGFPTYFIWLVFQYPVKVVTATIVVVSKYLNGPIDVIFLDLKLRATQTLVKTFICLQVDIFPLVNQMQSSANNSKVKGRF